MALLGLISDTHGHLDPRVEPAFVGVDAILHAGDVCASRVLHELGALGVPVTAVEGNCDSWEMPHEGLPASARIEVEGVRILVVHDRGDARGAGLAGVDVVVHGHTHRPQVERVAGVLWVNPGSAWKAGKSGIGRSVGLLQVSPGGDVDARIVALDAYGPKPPKG